MRIFHDKSRALAVIFSINITSDHYWKLRYNDDNDDGCDQWTEYISIYYISHVAHQ